jgi:hypothetical protein
VVRQKEFSLVFVRLQVLIYDRYTIGGGCSGWLGEVITKDTHR